MSNTTPTKQRTWQYDVNQFVTGATTQAGGANDGPEYRKALILAIKNSMIGFASNPWTVAGSSSFNDLTGAMDATDRWVDIDDIRWVNSTASNRSWIVLENAALGIQFLFDCVSQTSTDGSCCDAFIAPIGTPFTGGSINARPTSAAQVQIAFNNDTFSNPGSWGSGDDNAVARDYILNVWHSADGLSTRVVIILGGTGAVIGFWFFDEIVNQIGTLSNGWVANIQGASASDSTVATVAHFHENARSRGRSNVGTAITYYLGMPVNNWLNGSLREEMTTQNPYDGRVTVCPICVASESASWVGIFGTIEDLYFETGPGFTGRGYPASTRAWMQFGEFVFPWDGSTPLVA